ncbi:hypothetical protein KJY78_03325 [Canibacter sp. lx-45]|uniref:sensor histidine kinase n=1 Tax=Canibacter zhuwentaonis TaxID=2837491 RepID=UPI001BDD33DA|nr:hypothetical protein [Canibacter zhuwentaonis]MBT1035383.1 hypothetical protein [Canibacter zhuwentaonis]
MREGKLEDFRRIARARARGYKLTYFLVAAIIVLFELLFIAVGDLPRLDTAIVLAGYALVLTVAPWIGLVGDLLYVTLFVGMNLYGYESSFSFPVFGVFLIVVVWLIRHHSIAAISLLAGVSLLGILLSENPLVRTVSEIVVIVIVLSVGFTLRVFNDRKGISERSLATARQESRRALVSVRSELAAWLHDTIAKDLAQMAISAQNLAAAHPELAHEMESLTTIAQDASRRLRPMIMDLRFSVAAPSLHAAVKESASMLRSRSIVLNADMVSDIDLLLSRQAMLTASLFVRETATNALKYGQASSAIELYVDLNDDEVALMMSNQISTEHTNHAFTGGFGLANLQSRIEREGGRMSFASTGTQWIINATIPNLQNSTEGKDDE